MKKCPYARPVRIPYSRTASGWITRYYCTLLEKWCPLKARYSSCPTYRSRARPRLSPLFRSARR